MAQLNHFIPSKLFEAAMQYAIDRDQCTREHADALRGEGGANYRTTAYVLARKIQHMDKELAHVRGLYTQAKDTITILSTPTAETPEQIDELERAMQHIPSAKMDVNDAKARFGKR